MLYKRPNRFRFVYLVRHGQYQRTIGHPDGELTETGVRQALDVARALTPVPVDSIWSSTMYRAEQTAGVIRHRAFPELTVRRSWLVRERVFPGAPLYDEYHAAVRGDAELLDRIWARWFRPSNTERHDVIVCHGNLIRALVTRVIGADLACWRNMHPHNCGITRVGVFGSDFVRLLSFNEFGHIKASRRTIG